MTALVLAAAVLCWPSAISAPSRGPRAATALIRVPAGVRLAAPAVGVLGVGVWTAAVAPLAVALAASMLMTTVWRLAVRASRTRRRDRLRRDQLAALRALARELQAGAGFDAAVEAVRALPGPGSVALMAMLVQGSEPPDGSATDAVNGSVVAAVRLSRRAGIPLAALITRVADTLQHDLMAREQRATAVAGARLSAYLLAGLPVLGLVLGVGMGANPIPVLVGGGIGSTLLLVGAALTCAGLYWSGRIVGGG